MLLLLSQLVMASDLLQQSWEQYTRSYIQQDGRVIDWAAQSSTSSEGQAYALLRAAWIGDQPTFRRVQRWTVDNLQGGDPTALPAWKWGQQESGWGVLDKSSASDADQWMAWALLIAAKRFGNPDDAALAKILLTKIWEEDVVQTARGPVLLPGKWGLQGGVATLNPSYWLLFAWRDFLKVDPRWSSLIDPAYSLMAACAHPTGLQPDWTWLAVDSGALLPAIPSEENKSNAGFEAFRVAWTLAAEQKWSGEPRAQPLARPYVALLDRYRQEGRIPAVISPSGAAVTAYDYPGLYGALLPLWQLGRPQEALQVEQARLRSLRADHGWGRREDYYAQNWIWLGYALAELPRPEI